MTPLKIAMLSLTHGHTRKYYQTLRDSPKLDWVAACAENDSVERLFRSTNPDVPCYRDEQEMFDGHPDIEAVVLASQTAGIWSRYRLVRNAGSTSCR